jgi:hypothetical protein
MGVLAACAAGGEFRAKFRYYNKIQLDAKKLNYSKYLSK